MARRKHLSASHKKAISRALKGNKNAKGKRKGRKGRKGHKGRKR